MNEMISYLFGKSFASAAVNSALAAALFEVPFVRNRQPVPINRAEIEAHYTEGIPFALF